MKATNTRNLRWYMRYLHNKTGFFIVGMVIIYGLSGIIQTYRDTNLLKHDVSHVKQFAGNLSEQELGNALKMRNLKAGRVEGSLVYFSEGTYDRQSGIARWTTREWYSWVTPFTNLHKTASKSLAHYFTLLFAIALLFMSISAFWMFKPGTRLFSSGVWLTVLGILASALLVIFS